MGYTRYYSMTGKKPDQTFLDTVRKIIQIGEEQFDISIKGWDGLCHPVVNEKGISLNGDNTETRMGCETFLLNFEIEPDSEEAWMFCKTREKPYDIVVNAVLRLAEREGLVTDVGADGPSREEEAERLLGLAEKAADRGFIDAMRLHTTLYALYQEDWMYRHITPEERRDVYKQYKVSNMLERVYDSFEEYLLDNNGFHGELYACFDEFLDCEYEDRDYMEKLVSGSGISKEETEQIMASYDYYDEMEMPEPEV